MSCGILRPLDLEVTLGAGLLAASIVARGVEEADIGIVLTEGGDDIAGLRSGLEIGGWRDEESGGGWFKELESEEEGSWLLSMIMEF
jgi:hypothetical protein